MTAGWISQKRIWTTCSNKQPLPPKTTPTCNHLQANVIHSQSQHLRLIVPITLEIVQIYTLWCMACSHSLRRNQLMLGQNSPGECTPYWIIVAKSFCPVRVVQRGCAYLLHGWILPHYPWFNLALHWTIFNINFPLSSRWGTVLTILRARLRQLEFAFHTTFLSS